jgi:hypothetical protein
MANSQPATFRVWAYNGKGNAHLTYGPNLPFALELAWNVAGTVAVEVYDASSTLIATQERTA